MARRCAILAIWSIFALAPHTWAGVYNPAEKCPFAVKPDGTADELSFVLSFTGHPGGEFPLLYGTLMLVADANPLRAAENTDRKAVLDRIAKLGKPMELSPAALAGLGADYLRVGKVDDALNLLAARSRDRIPDFRVLANLAHVHATRGEWDDAIRWHQAAFLDAEFPDDLAGTTAEQRTWLKNVDRKHYRQWLQVHRDRLAKKERPDAEEVFPLFPVKFVNEAGQYEPGKLAASEKAKLPPDAIAIVQQLLLWAPWDTSLYWLLAELYTANGRLREAGAIMDRIADTRQYSNRPVFMAHRLAVQQVIATLPPPVPEQEVPLISSNTTPKPPSDPASFLPSTPRLIVAGIVFGLIVVIFGGLQIRAILRRR